MNNFVAPNGVEFVQHVSGLTFATEDGIPVWGINLLKVDALRAYFQHERDVELGRWRDPANPATVVYPGGSEALAMNEVRGNTACLALWEVELLPHDPTGMSLHDSLRRFFDAHPEPKSWHNAEEGEVWLISVDDSELPATVEGTNFWVGACAYPIASEDIKSARCIFPGKDAA